MAERGDVVWEDPPRRRGGVDGAGARVTGWTILLAVLGLAVVVGLLLTAPRERGEPLDGVPRELTGRWGTEDPRYSDRQMVIERERVELLLDSATGRTRHPLLEVRGWDEGALHGYRIRYGTPEGERTMEVMVSEDGTLQMKNPSDVIWRRVP